MNEKPAVKAIVIRNIKDESYFFYQIKKEPRRFRTVEKIRDDLPGGMVEAGETREQAVQREVKEETTMDIRPVRKVSEWRFERPEKKDILVGSTHLCEFILGEPNVSEELENGYWRKTNDKKGLPTWIVSDLRAAGY